MIDVQIILSIFALNISIIIWHMTLQQLKYIVAIDRYRNFAKAADACGISQPTLSAMLVKLEEELDVRIFERNNKNVQPTANGEQIIRQAERTLTEAERITWIVSEEKGKVAGELSLSVGPTIAPYILPKFIKHYVADFPQVTLSVKELKADAMLSELQLGHLDAGIAISGNVQQGILEIPLYTERFMVYLSENCWRKLPVFHPKNLEHEKMWVMKEAQCLRDSAFSFCKAKTKGRHIYEAGSIETLIRIVDENGGFTIALHPTRLHPPSDAGHHHQHAPPIHAQRHDGGAHCQVWYQALIPKFSPFLPLPVSERIHECWCFRPVQDGTPWPIGSLGAQPRCGHQR